MNTPKSERSLVLGGILPTSHSAIPSFAGASLEGLSSVAGQIFASAQVPNRKEGLLATHYQNSGIIMLPQGIKADSKLEINPATSFRSQIAAAADYILEQGTSPLDTILNTIAGAGESQIRTFMAMLKGGVETRTDAAGNLNPEYQAFSESVVFATGEILDILVDELFKRGLINQNTSIGVIGYESDGHDQNDQPNTSPDPLMSQAYSIIRPGKKWQKVVAKNWTEKGFNVRVYNTVEILTNSSQIFPAFEAIVLQRFLTRMWSNNDAQKNPFWQPLFEHIKAHYPNFESLAGRCNDLLYGDEVLGIWHDPNLNYGEKNLKIKKLLQNRFSGNERADMYRLSHLISFYLSKAFADCWIKLRHAAELAGQSETYIGHRRMAQVDLAPESTIFKKAQQSLIPPIDYQVQKSLNTAKGAEIFEPIGENTYQVVRGHDFENGHMGIVRGVESIWLATNGAFSSKKEYSMDFNQMMRPGDQFRVETEEIEGEKVVILRDCTDSTKIYATIKIKDLENPPAQLDSVVARKKNGSGGVNLISDWDEKTPQNIQRTLDQQGIKNEIPHDDRYLFANSVEIYREEGNKIFFASGKVQMPAGSGIEDLGDAAAQVCCAACEKSNFDTIFRGGDGMIVSESAAQQHQNRNIAGEYQVRARIQIDKNEGSAKFSLIVIDPKDESIVMRASKMQCAFL